MHPQIELHTAQILPIIFGIVAVIALFLSYFSLLKDFKTSAIREIQAALQDFAGTLKKQSSMDVSAPVLDTENSNPYSNCKAFYTSTPTYKMRPQLTKKQIEDAIEKMAPSKKKKSPKRGRKNA